MLGAVRHRERGQQHGVGAAAVSGRPPARDGLSHGRGPRGPGQVRLGSAVPVPPSFSIHFFFFCGSLLLEDLREFCCPFGGGIFPIAAVFVR